MADQTPSPPQTAPWKTGGPKERVERVQASLAGVEVDALLIMNADNAGYLSGFTGSSAHVLVSSNEAVLVTDPRYAIRARSECPEFEVVISSGSGGYLESLKGVLENRAHLKTVGFDAARVTVAQLKSLTENFEAVTWKPTEGVIETLRAVKDASEIATIRRAIDVAEKAFVSVKDRLRAGISERDFAIELDFAMRRFGAEALAFETIVASGPQSAHPHHRPNDRIIQPGDWVTVDWGALVDGYCSDMTRTVLIGPWTPTEKQQSVYQTVLTAQRMAIDTIVAGKNGAEIDKVARDCITTAGYGDNFGHSLGHALGRVVHDGAGFSSRAENHILTPGMVITVEPGIYIEEWGGIRIEEDIVVTETGCEVLTHLPNELEILT